MTPEDFSTICLGIADRLQRNTLAVLAAVSPKALEQRQIGEVVLHGVAPTKASAVIRGTVDHLNQRLSAYGWTITRVTKANGSAYHFNVDYTLRRVA